MSECAQDCCAPCACDRSHQCSTFFFRPVKKLSSTVTSCPCSISASTRCDPTKPACKKTHRNTSTKQNSVVRGNVPPFPNLLACSFQAHALSLLLTHTRTHTHTHTHAHTRTHIYSLTHSHTHSFTHTLSLSLSLLEQTCAASDEDAFAIKLVSLDDLWVLVRIGRVAQLKQLLPQLCQLPLAVGVGNQKKPTPPPKKKHA